MTEYGITWASTEHSVCQTGYVYASVADATAAAIAGPEAAREAGVQVDQMDCNDDRDTPDGCYCGGPLYGLVQTEDDTLAEVVVGGGEG